MYFSIREDAVGKPGLTPLQKCTVAIRQLAYGGAADMFDEYLHIGESTAVECLQNFCAGVRAIFGEVYLWSPSPEDCQRLIDMHGYVHGFPGMLGSIEFTGSNNDINVLQSSPLFNDQCNGVGPAISFVANGNQHNMGYYLADGRYPNWPVFVKTIKHPLGQKKTYFASRQEAAQGCGAEKEAAELTQWTNKNDTGAGPSHDVATANVNMGVPHGEVERMRAFTDMRQTDAHVRLQHDIIEEVWTRRGGR
ncbi:uncharacterized protein LOC125221381 [Salvia hispanica]|uniref:uncharacterized protein LOC125221381 n=1 Tax=Salvia hispanica TaxID=49212 RepID=UPI0020097C15|nr:uncharacterized protein LOC125221381 [Salvia hispanica]